ncbi:RagB/SusD family nutrient uptake outer membrane protein [Mucilaginibacter sp. UR6-1]|uniref:RagB/SusD family nutrient uptake outer membrane protein n=1 Tax=Mucilaginibacter sp. UR6-1 TaxID=1435643 RepID=UPI001E6089E2|nr:RagB/SusD family nutrient uptake outer membrane protein [Mucilaginibacter sp. UR6-1]MCC8407950.1 RagB/SusD family nutrient uptake outer membrane protein [Mucilaginibacter sp. UR6-1]
MIRKIYKVVSVIGCVAALSTFSSCKKLLEQTPKNSTYFDVYWKTAQDANNAIAGNYALLRNAMSNKYNRYYMYGDAVAKNYFTIQYGGDGIEGIQGGDFTFQYNLNSLANYTLYFKSVAMSNIILKNVSKMTDAQLKDADDPEEFRNKILGQAYFLRALSYFMMVRVWGDVPVVTEAYDDPINAPQLARSPKAEVMKLIEDDCHKAAPLLSWTYANVGDAKVTANRGSVYALLTHLYLWRATMLDVSSATPNMADVNSADTTINAIVSKGGYRLVDTANYKSIFVGRSSEGIFEINVSENTLEGSNSSIGMFFLNGSYINNGTNNPRMFVTPTYIRNHYQGNDTSDVRFKKNFALTTSERPMCIKYANVVYRNQGQQLDPYLSNNMVVFRLSDINLLRAEIALYKNNVGTAINIINDSRRRHNANPTLLENNLTKDEVMDEYIVERGRELFLEGHLFYDLLRTRKYGNVVDWLTDQRFQLEGFYFPVDPALFRQNPKLKQTTYWLGKV